jgi:hypothetical protein
LIAFAAFNFCAPSEPLAGAFPLSCFAPDLPFGGMSTEGSVTIVAEFRASQNGTGYDLTHKNLEHAREILENAREFSKNFEHK